MYKIAINGYGRIGRAILRSFYDNFKPKLNDLAIVAINDLGDPKVHAHLTSYDSNYGPASFAVAYNDGYLIINHNSTTTANIKMLAEPNPKNLPWKELQIDLVLECTGLFNSYNQAALHLNAGAKKVLVSSPMDPVIPVPTIVYGVNHHKISSNDLIVSNSSCTTNCLAPLLWAVHSNLKVKNGLMTTIHAYTNDQVLVDSYHEDLRRARAAAISLIPTKTGAASSIGLIFPELNHKIDGIAIRAPTLDVSLVDLTVEVARSTDDAEVNSFLKTAAEKLQSIVAVNELPLVSVDFKQNIASSIFDLTQTKVRGKLVKVLAWYDNEWGFAHRMIDTALIMVNSLVANESR